MNLIPKKLHLAVVKRKQLFDQVHKSIINFRVEVTGYCEDYLQMNTKKSCGFTKLVIQQKIVIKILYAVCSIHVNINISNDSTLL